MKISLFGGSGRLGLRLLEEASMRGHHVRALAREPSSIPKLRNVEVFRGDVQSNSDVVDVVSGSEVVISALGVGGRRGPTRVYSQGTSNILLAMNECRIDRIISVSATPAGPWEDTAWFERSVIYPILERAFGNCYADMRTMETVLQSSTSLWTVFRPPRLIDSPARGVTRYSSNGPLPMAFWLSRSDLAACMLDAIEDSSTYRRFVSVAR